MKTGNLSNPVKAIPKNMVWIPPGTFVMGTDEIDVNQEAIQLGFPRLWFENEHPRQVLDLDGYFIDQHEVTQDAYRQFTLATGHPPPNHWINGQYKNGKGNHPVSRVDWYDANDYCLWSGKHLPTEEEWEKAARGPDGQQYPWGNRFDLERAHLAPGADILINTAPAGMSKEGHSPYGVADMIGNVWEWTESWYLPYQDSQYRDKDFGMKFRVVKGLSFHSLGHYQEGGYERVLEVTARASTRSYDPPTERLEDLGFRCVKRGNEH
jgi:formylglycine-generating enzyme required for sulfatase activity